MSREAGKLDVEGFRDRIALAVGIDAGELTLAGRDNSRGARRMIAAYIILHEDKLPLDSIAQILGENESWVRNSTDYIAHRIRIYYAYRTYVDRMIERYARINIEAGRTSAAGVDSIRRRIAAAVGVTVAELVEVVDRDSDADVIQRVAAYLLSEDGLEVRAISEVMLKSEPWVHYSIDYITRRVKRGDRDLKSYVDRTTVDLRGCRR